jgi:2-polyprenyl-3-methyl-5-hydroxy-6-metoxy-1,4-benzoquinol methylase
MLKNKWFDFYKHRVNNAYEEYFNKKYSVFLNYLKLHIKPNYNVLEIGCGTSLVTKYLYKNNINFKVIDNNRNMLELSSINLKNKKVINEIFDIRNQLKGKYDVIYSHGVLEHFNPNPLHQIIKNQLKVCKFLVHYVPSEKYQTPSFGDEMLLNKKGWKELANPDKIIGFNNDFDLILIWDRR